MRGVALKKNCFRYVFEFVFFKGSSMMSTSDGMESDKDTSGCSHTSAYVDDYIETCRVMLPRFSLQQSDPISRVFSLLSILFNPRKF